MNQGKNIYLFFSKLEEKKGKEIFFKSPLEYINTTKIYTHLTPQKIKSNKFSIQYFFRNNFSLPFHNFPNKQTTSTHYALLHRQQFVCGARDASHPRSKTP